MSHLKRSHVMAAFIRTLHLLLKTGWRVSGLAGYKRVAYSPTGNVFPMTYQFGWVCVCVCVSLTKSHSVALTLCALLFAPNRLLWR